MNIEPSLLTRVVVHGPAFVVIPSGATNIEITKWRIEYILNKDNRVVLGHTLDPNDKISYIPPPYGESYIIAELSQMAITQCPSTNEEIASKAYITRFHFKTEAECICRDDLKSHITKSRLKVRLLYRKCEEARLIQRDDPTSSSIYYENNHVFIQKDGGVIINTTNSKPNSRIIMLRCNGLYITFSGYRVYPHMDGRKICRLRFEQMTAAILSSGELIICLPLLNAASY